MCRCGNRRGNSKCSFFDKTVEFWHNGAMTQKTKIDHHERYDPHRSRRLGILAFFFGFSESFLAYILSSYFETAIGNSNVSLFYLLAHGGILITLFYTHALIRLLGVARLFLLLLFAVILFQFFLSLLPISIGGAGFLVGYLVVTTISWTVLDIALERYSEDKRSGRIRGLFLFAASFGYILAPFFSTFVLGKFGFSGIFAMSVVFFSILFLLAIFAFSGVNPRFDTRVSPFAILSTVRKRVDILRIYAVSFAVEFFYGVMVVYTPLRLRELGMSWEDIGIIFTVMLIPFLFVHPIGFLADKRMGEKELLIGALIIAVIATSCIAFVSSSSVAVWAGVLFATRIGVAAIEVLRDSYFYKRIDGKDGALIAFFRTARPTGNITAAFAVGIWLLFFPLSSVFLLPAVVLALALLPALMLEDNLSEREVAL